MKVNSNQFLYTLPVFLTQNKEGFIVSLGLISFELKGVNLFEIAKKIIDLTEHNLSKKEILEKFNSAEKTIADEIIQAFLLKKIFYYADSQNITHKKTANDIFYWHFNADFSSEKNSLDQKIIALVGINSISLCLIPLLKEIGIKNIQIIDDPCLRNDVFISGIKNLVYYKKLLDSAIKIEDLALSNIHCLLAISDYPEKNQLIFWNNFCVKHNLSYFPIEANNLKGSIGPYVTPGKTACYECFLKRENSNLFGTQKKLSIIGQDTRKSTGFHPSIPHILSGIVALELFDKINSLDIEKHNQFIDICFLPYEVCKRTVLRVPDCFCLKDKNS